MLWIQIESFAYFSIKIYLNICTEYRYGVEERCNGTRYIVVYALPLDAMSPNLRFLSKVSINLNYYLKGENDEYHNIFILYNEVSIVH